jgi:hypothetical protein
MLVIDYLSIDLMPIGIVNLYGCKDTTKFADLQILSGKSFRSFKSSKGG